MGVQVSNEKYKKKVNKPHVALVCSLGWTLQPVTAKVGRLKYIGDLAKVVPEPVITRLEKPNCA